MNEVVQKENLLYEGKGKKVFRTSDPALVLFEFKNDLTAFNAQKRGTFVGKGEINCAISDFFFRVLEKNNIPTHWLRRISKTEALVKKIPMIPLELIVRNQVAGTLEKRLGLPRGHKLKKSIVEFCYKRDDLGDPIVTEAHIYELGVATNQEIKELTELGLKTNDLLRAHLGRAGFELADFKMEVGRQENTLVVADEFSPDSMRLWNANTHESFDKDRFRFDMGDVGEGYREALARLQRSDEWAATVTAF